MSDTSRIVVAGDVTYDWYFWKRNSDPKNGKINWKLFDGLNMSPQPGGAFLLSKMIKENIDATKKILTYTEQNLIKILGELTKTQRILTEIQRNLKDINENLDGTQKTQNEPSNTLEKKIEDLKKVEISLNKIPESLDINSESMNEIQKCLTSTQESLDKTLESFNNTQRRLNAIEKDQEKTKKSLEDAGKNLGDVQDNLNYVKENLVKYLNSLRKIQCDLKKKDITILNQWRNISDSLNNFNKFLHTNIILDLFPPWEPDSKNQVFRVKDYSGFITPPNDYPEPLAVVGDKGTEDFIIIHDVGNGFRFEEDKWPIAIKEISNNPVIVYHMYPPLFEGELWERAKKNHRDNLILILNAEDLRKLGINISRSLSWEKTALEFLWEIKHNNKLKAIKNLKNVIIRFKVEGVIHYSGSSLYFDAVSSRAEGVVHYKKDNAKLYFDPSLIEGGFWDKKFGTMRGVSIAFVASFASELITKRYIEGKDTLKALEPAIKVGLLKSREFLKKGHGTTIDVNNFYGFSREDPNQIRKEYDYIKCVSLPDYNTNRAPDPNFWSILREIPESKEQKEYNENKDHRYVNLVNVAEDIVINGWSAIEDFPAGHFGELTTVDRTEIESFGSLKSIMEGYINSKIKNINAEHTPKPLSISVFGPPGSGKSFGIKKVAKSIDSKKVCEIDFNVSQFTSVEDLTNAFHRIRDISLKGKVPLVFFDEFDCTFEKRPLGWLRYFLAPMQDGVFVDCGIEHPIGKSIFVFAGGIYKNFKEFCKNTSDTHEPVPEKCPDFISRLRGYVNILGPNRIDEDEKVNDKRDDAYIIRRAVQLRSLIERNVPNIIIEQKDINGRIKKVANIDSSLLKALLLIPRYKHGVRSMEAIIDMSILQELNSWETSSLPPEDQLQLHVDAKQFFMILENPMDFSIDNVSSSDLWCIY